MNHQRPIEQRFGGPLHQRSDATRYAPDPARIALHELHDAIQGYLSPESVTAAEIADARLVLALNAARNVLKAVFSCPEGGAAVIEFPTPLTLDTLEMLADLCALMFRGMKRDAEERNAQQVAEDEYRSWFEAGPARA